MSTSPIYLDPNGNPISSLQKTYLDENGNPISAPHQAVSPEVLDALRAQNQKNDEDFGHVTPTMSATPGLLSARGLKSAFYTGADKLTNMLPAAGGLIGGMIGGGAGTVVEPGGGSALGAIGGAGVGGMGGEAAKQLLRRKLFPEDSPATSGEAAKGITTQGLEQAAYEAGGRGLEAGAKVVAPRLVEAALAPGKRLLKSIPEDVDIGQTALENTKPFSLSAKSMSRDLSDRLAEKESAMRNLVSDADRKYMIKPAGLLPAAPTEIPLGAAPTAGKMPGTLLDAEPFPRRNVVGGPATAQNIEQLGSTANTVPTRLQNEFYTSGRGPVTPGMEPPPIEGPGVMLSRDSRFQPPSTPSNYPSRLAEGAPSLTPARNSVDKALADAEYKQSEPARNAILRMRERLTSEIGSGQQIPSEVLPSRIRAIKQGVGDDINWNPEIRENKTVLGAKKSVYGLLDREFNRAVPGSASLDKSMTSLIPTKKAAWNAAYDPSVTQSLVEKLRRPTGALFGAGAGYYEGKKAGGTTGGLIGAGAGLVGGNIVASPEMMKLAAEGLYHSGIPIRSLRALLPLALSQINNDKDKNGGEK